MVPLNIRSNAVSLTIHSNTNTNKLLLSYSSVSIQLGGQEWLNNKSYLLQNNIIQIKLLKCGKVANYNYVNGQQAKSGHYY